MSQVPYQGFSTRAILPPREYVAMSGNIFAHHHCGEGYRGIECVKVRDVAKHPAMPSTTQNYPAQNRAKAGEFCSILSTVHFLI